MLDVQGTGFEFLEKSNYLGNSMLQWLVFLTLAFVFCFVMLFARRVYGRKLGRMAAKTPATWDDVLARVVNKTHGLFLFALGLYFGAQVAGLTLKADVIVNKIFVISSFFQAALWGNEVLALLLSRYLAKRAHLEAQGSEVLNTYSAINIMAKFVLWTVLFLLLLDNLGVNITALVTGLGIGGIAIALAVQNIVGDIFASLTIVVDRPFEVGDFIVVGDKSGTVESVGLKTSRVKALSGEQLVFPNKKLIDNEVQNFKRMQERRIVFGIGLDYNTPLEKLKLVPQILTDIIKKQEKVRFDRAHFKSFGESTLDFEIVYIMLTADYGEYMNVQQTINFEILEAFREADIEIAFPSRSLYIENLEDMVKDRLPVPGNRSEARTLDA